MEYGFIYKITNTSSGKSYIGQAREYKTKNGIPYKYGITGRWNDHTYEVKRNNTKPLYQDIKKYGEDAFDLEEICKVPLKELDSLEAKYIINYNTLIPNGYNITKHSRNRHHKTLNLAEYFKDRTNTAVLKNIKKQGKNHLVYLYLELTDSSEKERIVFGQTDGSSYEDAYKEAIEFVKKIGCSYTIQDDNILEERYKNRLEQFKDKKITRVRVTSASNLIAVYIKTDDTQVRICFGGKHIKKDEALMIANTFVDLLDIPDTSIIETTQQCLQQAAASMDETTP